MFFLERKICQKISVEKIKTRIFVQQTFLKIVPFIRYADKYFLEPDRPQVTNNTTQGRCDLHGG
jgi:hypothetical protein